MSESKRTILLVDDSQADLDSYRRVFKDKADTQLLAAGTAEAGLELARHNHVDIIVADYNLPDMNGVEFLRRLAEFDASLPVIMLTGSGNEAVAVEAMKAGAADYLVKEVDGRHLTLLATVVNRVIREYVLRAAKRAADAQLRLAANVFHNVAEGILTTDPDGNIVAVNPAFCALTGYAAEQLLGRNPRILKSNRHDADFYRELWRKILEDGTWQGEIWNRRADGALFLARVTITAIRDDDGRIQHYVAVLVDITETHHLEEFMRHQAYHDPLTGLPNRSLLMDRLNQQVAAARRHQSLLAVLFVDLDGFKQVNDELGHDVGDDLLRAAATRLKASVREMDTVGRLGGDEFIVIVTDLSDGDAAVATARKILAEMSRPFAVGDYTPTVSASVGIALYPDHANSGKALIDAADEAMYRVKRAGRADYAFADDIPPD